VGSQRLTAWATVWPLCYIVGYRIQFPRGLRHELSSLARTLGSWARIPLKAWMSVFCEFILCFCCSLCC
jgi:hypothetical protein